MNTKVYTQYILEEDRNVSQEPILLSEEESKKGSGGEEESKKGSGEKVISNIWIVWVT